MKPLEYIKGRQLMPASSERQKSYMVRRRYGQAVIIALVWPFLAAVIQIRRFHKDGILVGFVVFCVWAGWTYLPSEGSDAYTYANLLTQHGTDAYTALQEPFGKLVFWILGQLGLGYRAYFALVGLLYGLVVAFAFRLLLGTRVQVLFVRFAALFFVGAVFLNFPVFSAINARFWFGTWIMILALLLVLDDRPRAGGLVGVFAVMVHFGLGLIGLVIAAFVGIRKLGKWQIWAAYGALVLAFVLPGNALLEWFAANNPIPYEGFGEKLERYAGAPEHRAQLALEGVSRPESAWFLQWYRTPIFWSLLVSGHLLFLSQRRHLGEKEYQLWIFVILMLAMQVAVREEVSSFGRLQSINLSLLLLWHARWFLERARGARMALVINAGPVLFYFSVFYRRALNDANVAAFLPTPFGVYPEVSPSVMRALGFGG